jgi:hypothetical protein
MVHTNKRFAIFLMVVLKLKWKKKIRCCNRIRTTRLRLHPLSSVKWSESPLPTGLRWIFKLHNFNNSKFTFISIYKYILKFTEYTDYRIKCKSARSMLLDNSNNIWMCLIFEISNRIAIFSFTFNSYKTRLIYKWFILNVRLIYYTLWAVGAVIVRVIRNFDSYMALYR